MGRRIKRLPGCVLTAVRLVQSPLPALLFSGGCRTLSPGIATQPSAWSGREHRIGSSDRVRAAERTIESDANRCYGHEFKTSHP
jgi:hypothetical protein